MQNLHRWPLNRGIQLTTAHSPHLYRTKISHSAPHHFRQYNLVYRRRFATHTREVTTGTPYWQKISRWTNVTHEQFQSYRWQLANTVARKEHLFKFLSEVLPDTLEPSNNPRLQHIRTRQEFIADSLEGLKKAPMAIRLTPHILSVVNWHQPLDDPIRRQFLPLQSSMIEDHPKLTLDSLHEEVDSPVPGLVHRYPDKVLFLATSICPVYCRFCTRSYAVGGNTETVSKVHQKPSRNRWRVIFDHIAETEVIQDVVVSGGDTYFLQPEDIKEIGETLLDIPHVQRVRFASKGLAVVPCRTRDPNDSWTATFIALSNRGRKRGKQVCLHTHFNHPHEITWITRDAARYLFENGVIVRNQSVLLKGVNDDVHTMGTLLRSLADMNIQPYYVYQCDLVSGIEDLRTPLNTILQLEQQLRGTIAGFMMPSFVVDLPEGGGKRLAASYESYDRESGISTYKAPGLLGDKGTRIYEYHDPKPTDTTVVKARQISASKENCGALREGSAPGEMLWNESGPDSTENGPH